MRLTPKLDWKIVTGFFELSKAERSTQARTIEQLLYKPRATKWNALKGGIEEKMTLTFRMLTSFTELTLGVL